MYNLIPNTKYKYCKFHGVGHSYPQNTDVALTKILEFWTQVTDTLENCTTILLLTGPIK